MPDLDTGDESESSSFDIRQASSLRGPEARKWFARQLMLPEWIIDVPDSLSRDCRIRHITRLIWYVGGVTRFMNVLRFFWLQSKLDETGACDPPSFYHKFRFSAVLFYNCDQSGLHSAYTVKDGLLFYNKHAHYHTGNTPLVLIWKDESCSQYVIDTDNNGQVSSQQHIVLELQDNGKIVTSDDPPVPVGCLNAEFVKQPGLSSGSLIRFAIGNGGLRCVDGNFEKADLHYTGVSNRARAFADSYSKIMFQYMARHSPLKVEDLASVISHENQQDNSLEVDMSD